MPGGMSVFLLFFSYIFILQTRAQLSFLQLDLESFQLQLNERQYNRLPLGLNATGPESIAFDCEGGGPYVGVSDGRILKWQGNSTGWTVFAITSPFWEYRSINASDRSGRLMRYRPNTGVVSILLSGLSFANGVALSNNKNFLLVAETELYRVQRYWLKGPKVGTSEVFIQLTGKPDNIHCNANGDFWIAQNPTKPIKVSESKMILESLDTNEIVDASDVIEFGDTLWIGSVIQSYVMYSTSSVSYYVQLTVIFSLTKYHCRF